MATTLGNGNITFGDGTTLSTASMIQSIQRGTSTASAVNISAVNTAKCMVLTEGNIYGSSFQLVAYFTTFNSTTQFAMGGISYYQPGYYSWQVIEFK